MHNARFKVMAGLAGATLCLFAVTSYAQTPTTTGAAGTPDASAQTATPQGTQTDAATTPAPTDAATDVTTTTSTTTWSFPGGILGMVAVAALVLLVLFALFRGKDRTVIRETYAASPPSSSTRPSTGTAADDRLNANSRAASGTGTNSGGINDPNARR